MLARLLRLIFWAALAFAFVMASMSQPLFELSLSGATLHMLVFAMLALMVACAYPRVSLISLFFALSLFGLVIECVQAIPALGRSASLEDWVADIIGAGVVLLLIGWVRWLRSCYAV